MIDADYPPEVRALLWRFANQQLTPGDEILIAKLSLEQPELHDILDDLIQAQQEQAALEYEVLEGELDPVPSPIPLSGQVVSAAGRGWRIRQGSRGLQMLDRQTGQSARTAAALSGGEAITSVEDERLLNAGRVRVRISQSISGFCHLEMSLATAATTLRGKTLQLDLLAEDGLLIESHPFQDDQVKVNSLVPGEYICVLGHSDREFDRLVITIES